MRLEISQGTSFDIDRTYSIEIKHRDKYEVIAVKRGKREDYEETVLSRHILECDAENKKLLIEAILKREE